MLILELCNLKIVTQSQLLVNQIIKWHRRKGRPFDSIQAAGVMAAELLNQDLHFIDAEKASYVVMDLERIAQEMEA